MATIVRGKSEKLEEMRKEDSKIVKGKFSCHMPKGGQVKFPYRKYKGEPIANYTLKDGESYDLPIGVVKHLNNCGTEVSAHLLDANGTPIVGVGKKDYRFSFQSLDFV